MKIEQLPLDDTYGFHTFYGKDGEKFLPKVETDEFFYNSENKWLPVACVCDACQDAWRGASESIYRRQVAIPDDCELVGLDEVCGMCDYIQRNGERHAVTGPCWQSLTPRQILAKSKTFPHTSAVEPVAFIRRKKTEVKPQPFSEKFWCVMRLSNSSASLQQIDSLPHRKYQTQSEAKSEAQRLANKNRNAKGFCVLECVEVATPEKSLVEVEFEKLADETDLPDYPSESDFQPLVKSVSKQIFLAALTLAKNKPELLKEIE